MSYQVLARKWRPRFFDEMVGQEHVLRALINALNEQRLHHAYLFTGTRGVGKTTIARILAKCLNCEQGISARPCGECSSCREIAEGRFVDLIEVDAASRTRVEDTRELLDNVQYAPTRGRFKVYLIDEVHMLSTHSFNALLKTLEEPPAHVKFLLATTDPQKLPVTILSRCLQFSLKNMSPESIVGYLETVLTAESVSYEIPALWQLGRAAQGSMRDALSLTDQAIAFGEGQVSESQVTTMLGTMDRGRLFRLAEIMARGSAREVLAEVADMAEHAPDYDEVVQGLLGLWHRASLAQVVPEAIDNTQGDRAAILALAQAMNPEDLQLYYQIAVSGRKDLALAPEPRQGFEMLVLRMLAFRPLPDINPAADLDLVTLLEQQTSEKKKHLTAGADLASGLAGTAPIHVAPVPQQSAAAAPVAAPAPAISDTVVAVAPASILAAPAIPVVPAVESVADTASSFSEQSPSIEAEFSVDTDGGDWWPESDSGGAPAWSGSDDDEEEDYEVQPVQPRGAALASLLDSPLEPVVVPEPVMAPTPATGPAELDDGELPELEPHTWWRWVERLGLAGLTLSIARNSALIQRRDTHCEFDVDPMQGALYNATHAQKIEQALAQKLAGCKVVMQLQHPRGETPEQRRQRLLAEAAELARRAIETDPQVRNILGFFNAVVLPESVRPLNS